MTFQASGQLWFVMEANLCPSNLPHIPQHPQFFPDKVASLGGVSIPFPNFTTISLKYYSIQKAQIYKH